MEMIAEPDRLNLELLPT